MRTLSPPLTFLVLLVFLWGLFGIKLNLVDFGGSGLRVDDVVFALSLPLLILAVDSASVSRRFTVFVLFVLASLLSLVLAGLSGRVAWVEGIFYWMRNLQYLSFFLIGLLLASRISLEKILKAYTIYLVVFLVLQYFNLIPTFSQFIGSGRAVANTGGPYELAVIAAFLAFFFWHQSPNKLYFLCAVFILFLTQSRITLFGFLLILFIFGVGTKGRIVVGLLAALLAVIFTSIELPVLARYAELFDEKTLETFTLVVRDIPSFRDTWSYREWAFTDFLENLTDSGDISSIIRFSRQIALVQSSLACGAECVVFGLGPSFGSSAVDGNLVRLFVEFGVVGMTLFLVGTYQMAKSTRNKTVTSYFFLLIITAVAIDILVSSKAMSLFWFLCGFYSIKNEVLSGNRISDAGGCPDKTGRGYPPGREVC